MMLWYSNYVNKNRDTFLNKVVSISNQLGINPNWLMFVMYWESGLNPAISNKYTGATGLIQFMPTTAISLGTSVSELGSMSNVEQLDYVYKYFRPYAGRMKNLYDVYLVTFFPAALGKSDNWILQTSSLSPRIIAEQNPAIDLNKDKQITVGEFKQYIDLKKKDLR